jgi:hypothetical protein
MKKLQETVEQAKAYKEDLQSLLDLDFKNPNENLQKFSKEHNMDLSNPEVQNEFLQLRKEYLERINKFYEDNFLNLSSNKVLDNKKQTKAKSQLSSEIAKQIKNQIIQNKKPEEDTTPLNLINKNKPKKKPHSKKNNQDKLSKKFEISPTLVGIIILFILLLYYLIFDRYN